MRLAGCLKVAVLAILFLMNAAASPGSATGTTWVVRLDGTGDFTRIQDAVEIAQPGDTVLVGPGRYTWTHQGPGDNPDIGPPHGMVVMWVNRPLGVTYVSEAGPEQTILDAEGQGRVVFANGDNDSNNPVIFTFRGFTITGGVAPKAPNNEPLPRQGGGLAMHLVYPLIEDCIFENNWGETGGGVWAGGVSSVEFRNCKFLNNRALSGAGIYLINSYEQTRLIDCLFIGNEAAPVDGVGGSGGGVFAANYNFLVERCMFYDNGATVAGSALCAFNGKPGILRYNTFRNNAAPVAAVGLRWAAFGSFTADYEFEHNVIAFNSPGSAVLLDPNADANFACNDIFGNSGGNWSGDISFWQGIAGNISQDPLFCATDGETWTVERSSPTLAANNSCSDMIGLSLSGGPSCGGLGLGEGDDEGDDPIDPLSDPQRLVVHAVAPNPLMSSAGTGTLVTYELPRDSQVQVAVFDLAGRRVTVLHEGREPAGPHEIRWSGADALGRAVAAGVYLVQVRTEQRTVVRRVVVLS